MPVQSKSNEEVPAISARHLVSFYRQPNFPVEAVCDYLAEGLNAGEAAVAVVTPEHAESITRELKARGLPVGDLTADGRFACADLASSIAQLVDPRITKQAKDEMITQWVEESLGRAPARRCRFLGELVSLMVAQGEIENAVDLEDTWNHLLATYPAMLYCIYEQTPFEQSAVLSDFCDICNRHDAVLATHLKAREGKEPPAWFGMLQEQASALREEVLRRRRAERLVFVNEANRLSQLEALMRVHGPNLRPMEKNDIVKVVSELQTQARKERWHTAPESAEWHKKTGEILGYEKVIASVMRAGQEPSGGPNVS